MLRFGSGTYNVRDTENIAFCHPTAVSPQHYKNDLLTCTVYLLDAAQENFEIDIHTCGQDLLDKVACHLDLIEKDYFGFKFVDLPSLKEHEQMRWLDPSLSIVSQLRCPPYALHFRVKFYVANPEKLLDEHIRYLFYLQLKRDLLCGKLFCTNENALAFLISYAVQSEFGDYSPGDHDETYLNSTEYVANQSKDLLEKVVAFHKMHKGQTPADAEKRFLAYARGFESYGVSLFDGQDANGEQIQIGPSYAGISVFQKTQLIVKFSWSKILKLSFKRKLFFVRLSSVVQRTPPIEHSSTDAMVMKFKLTSTSVCKFLWKSCVEHHTFFRLITPPSRPRKHLFNFGFSTYRFSGRTEYQTLEESKRQVRSERVFTRLNSKSSSRTCSKNVQNSPIIPRYQNSSDSQIYADIDDQNLFCFDHESQSGRLLSGVQFGDSSHLSSVSRPIINGDIQTTCTNHLQPVIDNLNHHRSSPVLNKTKSTTFSVEKSPNFNQQRRDAYEFKPKSPFLNMGMPGVVDVHNEISPSTSIAMSTIHGLSSTRYPAIVSPNGRRHNSVRPFYASSSVNQHKHRQQLCQVSESIDANLVTIRMRPDDQGRFGFNVKGGSDLNYPIIVSRVVAESKADQCWPRLNEGDQILSVNGLDVSCMIHDHLIRYIRGLSLKPDQDLVLVVKPNAYIGDEIEEADFLQTIPQTAYLSDFVPKSELLEKSINLLKASIETGEAVQQFERLHRRAPTMTTTVCLYPQNVYKNRYADILPYDSTRVIIRNNDSGGDYINANFVNMEIKASGIVNRYIAAQGPLPHTCCDFWNVIWEQVCPTIVMLTTLNERGRPKCHQYWPDCDGVMEFNCLTLKCSKEYQKPFGFCRDFQLECKRTGEKRTVSQLQYTVWPDHGVPDDSSQFINFMSDVRQSRTGTVEPLLVHCSAGIGRTGVLILMETAMCLIEANEPVYTLDLVKSMRVQRAMLIQTSCQYRFVCDAICKAYSDGVVRPLAEYQTKQ